MSDLVNDLIPSRFRITEDELRSLEKFLKNARKVAVITHISADSDAFGSATALAMLLSLNYQIDVRYITEDSLDGEWLSLIGTKSKWSEIISFVPSLLEGLEEYSPSHIIAVDINHYHRLTSRKDTIDSLKLYFARQVKGVAVIDHHVTSPSEFGSVRILKPFTSTAELLFVLAELFDWEYDEKVANLLLLGVLGDLGRLRWLKYRFSLEIISRLLAAGANWRQVYKILGMPVTKTTLEALSSLLKHIEYKRNFAYLVLDYEMYQKFRSFALSRAKSFIKEHILSQTKKPAYVFVTEKNKGKYYFSLFSEEPNLDVHEFAMRFGGGGHEVAAAFLKETDKDGVKKLLEEFDQFLDTKLHGGS